ncbi:hypothetical protein K490DRAFT_65920 [Saccharata proteae CBS 121410]|uniref:Uncharacterized protein n=1 Tax=Saccharata proteae CBS 121410 TaxID=1314787 RepID=A0A9P4HUF8_9PEZI|nr:hypothetical protein K490DRAFT_65920 [Saccharata proteae CBS 121410]
MATFYTHTGPLPPYSPHAPLRFLSTYLHTLSLHPSTLAPLPASTFFSPHATLHTSIGHIHSSAAAVWTALQEEREKFDFVHWQTCVTRVFGMGASGTEGLEEGARVVVSCQAVALVRLKGFDEERLLEVPVCWEGVLGRAVEEEGDAGEGEEGEGGEEGNGATSTIAAIEAWSLAAAETSHRNPGHENASKQRRERKKGPGTEGLQLFECRIWWDSGVLVQAEKEREKEEEKRKFREMMGLNRGFLGMGRRGS